MLGGDEARARIPAHHGKYGGHTRSTTISGNYHRVDTVKRHFCCGIQRRSIGLRKIGGAHIRNDVDIATLDGLQRQLNAIGFEDAGQAVEF